MRGLELQAQQTEDSPVDAQDNDVNFADFEGHDALTATNDDHETNNKPPSLHGGSAAGRAALAFSRKVSAAAGMVLEGLSGSSHHSRSPPPDTVSKPHDTVSKQPSRKPRTSILGGINSKAIQGPDLLGPAGEHAELDDSSDEFA